MFAKCQRVGRCLFIPGRGILFHVRRHGLHECLSHQRSLTLPFSESRSRIAVADSPIGQVGRLARHDAPTPVRAV